MGALNEFIDIKDTQPYYEICFDTETTGRERFITDILQIGFAVFLVEKAEGGKRNRVRIGSRKWYAKFEGVFPDSCYRVHKILNHGFAESPLRHAPSLLEVNAEFRKFYDGIREKYGNYIGILTGYNIQRFDLPIWYLTTTSTAWIDKQPSKTWKKVILDGTDIVGFTDIMLTCFPKRKLEHVYLEIVNKNAPADQHDALVDVNMCAEIRDTSSLVQEKMTNFKILKKRSTARNIYQLLLHIEQNAREKAAGTGYGFSSMPFGATLPTCHHGYKVIIRKGRTYKNRLYMRCHPSFEKKRCTFFQYVDEQHLQYIIRNKKQEEYVFIRRALLNSGFVPKKGTKLEKVYKSLLHTKTL